MEHLKKKKRFSWRDLLYKSLLFVGTVALIVYFLHVTENSITSSTSTSPGNTDS